MKHRGIPALFLLGFVSLSLVGCDFARPEAAPPLPTVEWETFEDARQVLIDRQDAIESVQAQLQLKFTSPPPESETQTLDAALVMQGNDHFRLRAWKLNQTIFDLTVTPDGTFVLANQEMKKQLPDAENELAKLSQRLGAFVRGPDYRSAEFLRDRPAQPLPLDFSSDHGVYARWDEAFALIDGQNLTPHTLYFRQQGHASLGEVKTTYAVYDGLHWYEHVKARGDFGEVEMAFRDVELNGELNPRAFRPSRRAVRVERPTAGPGAQPATP